MNCNSYHSIRPTFSLPSYTISSHGTTALNLFIFVSLFSVAAAQSKPNSYLSGNSDTSTAILVVVLVCAFLITGCLSLYIRGCSGFDESSFTTITSTGRSLSVIVVSNSEGRSRRGRGLDKALIDTFPTFYYSEVKELKFGKGSLECAVCLSEFEDEESLRLLTKCDHVFHTECIDKWLSAHKTCPVCRANLVPSTEESAAIENNQVNQSESDSNLSESDAGEADREEHCDCREPPRQVRTTTLDEIQGRRAAESIDGVKENDNQGLVIDENRKYHMRSHSTGHSITQPRRSAEEYHERFRLRLPEEVRKQIVKSSNMKRVPSCDALSQDSSSRCECRRNVDGEDRSVFGGNNRRSKRWLAEWWWMTGAAMSVDGERNQVMVGTSSSSKGILTKAANPLEWVGKQEPAGSRSQNRPPV